MSKIRKENKGWQKYCRSIRKKFPIVENSYKYEKNINSYYLNLVYNNFSDKIKNTKYGKKLQKKIKSL